MYDVETFRGWANVETWVVNMWLTNNSMYFHNVLREVIKEYNNVFDMADSLEDTIRDFYLEEFDEVGMWRDLLSTSIDRVDWQTIIENNIPVAV